jgi:hypothetical protein
MLARFDLDQSEDLDFEEYCLMRAAAEAESEVRRVRAGGRVRGYDGGQLEHTHIAHTHRCHTYVHVRTFSPAPARARAPNSRAPKAPKACLQGLCETYTRDLRCTHSTPAPRSSSPTSQPNIT